MQVYYKTNAFFAAQVGGWTNTTEPDVMIELEVEEIDEIPHPSDPSFSKSLTSSTSSVPIQSQKKS